MPFASCVSQAYAEILTSDENCGYTAVEHSTGLGENVFVCANPIDDRAECFTPGAAMEYFCEFVRGPPGFGYTCVMSRALP